MFQVPVNYPAVLVSAVAYMVIGFAWYGGLFAETWMKLNGMTKADMEKSKKKGMGMTYGMSFLGALVMAYVLAHFIYFTLKAAAFDPGVTPIMVGIKTGFWSWLGFAATTGMNNYLFAPKPKPWMLYAVDQGYLLLTLLVSGAILGMWM